MPLTIDRNATNSTTRNNREKASWPEKTALNKSYKKGIYPINQIKIGAYPIVPAIKNVLVTNLETLSSPL